MSKGEITTSHADNVPTMYATSTNRATVSFNILLLLSSDDCLNDGGVGCVVAELVVLNERVE